MAGQGQTLLREQKPLEVIVCNSGYKKERKKERLILEFEMDFKNLFVGVLI